MRTIVLVSLSFLVACSTGRNGHHGGGGDGGSGKNDGGIPTGDGGNPTGTSCTGDLRGVVDSSGNLIQTCGNDQGCAGGQCVPACDAAASSKGSLGCDYMVSTPGFYVAEAAPCFAVFVANSWPTAATLSVDRGGMTYDVTQFGRIAAVGQPPTSWGPIPSTGIPQGSVGVLFMSHDPGGSPTCPVEPAVSQMFGTAITNDASPVTGLGQAFHITTSVPATLYDILPFGGASSYLPSASLLFPTTAWGTNYLGIVAKRANSDDGGFQIPQLAQVVASQDDTQITVLSSVDLPGGTNVTAAPTGQPTTFTLSAGQFLQWTDTGEMSGTVIQSNKPIGFVGGTTYDCYTSNTNGQGGCDSNHQQIPPISAFGSSYAIAPYASRNAGSTPESIIYRIVGSVDGTTLTYDPPVGAGPTMLGKGQVVDFESTTGFVVSAQDNQHPFYVAQVMSGCNTDSSRDGCGDAFGGGLGCCLGDEDTVNVLAPLQYLSSYIFFTDLTYATTNLVFTRAKHNGTFADVTLDCLGAITGWQNLDTAGNYQYAQVDLIRGNVNVGSCTNGPHSATSGAPFGLTVWGLDYCASYAYPAGGNIGAINDIVLPPIN